MIEIIRSGRQGSKKAPSSLSSKRKEQSAQVRSDTLDNEVRTTRIQSDNHPATSIADELAKLAKLKDQGIITEAEFVQVKGNLIKKT